MYFEVIPTEVFRANSDALTYQSDQELLPGQIVLIPIGHRTVTGVVLRKIAKVDFPTKPITRLLHPYPIPQHLLASITWLSKYYLSSLPATANLMIPAGITARGAIKATTVCRERLKERSADREEREPRKDGCSSGSLETNVSNLERRHFIILCPHYEGYDERILTIVDHPISLGNYVLTGGELPALIIIDSVARLLPGVLGGETSAMIESFSNGDNLEYPQYTKPADFRGLKVPEVLMSGNHGAIAKWRAEHSGKQNR